MTLTVRKVKVTLSMSGELPLSTRLMRSQPAAYEGPEEAWRLAQEIIDHAAHFLDTLNEVQEARKVRDLVLAALLRRAILLAEGVRVNLFYGLEEPAIVLLRALLEVELNMRLVTADPTDSMAKRMAAYHYLQAKRHVTKVLGHPEVQSGDREFMQFMKDAGKRQKDYFQSSAFDDVREDLSNSQHWHGYPSIEAAFRAVGCDTDYLHLYDSFSPFVHSANVDHDFVNVVDDQPHLRPPRHHFPALSGRGDCTTRLGLPRGVAFGPLPTRNRQGSCDGVQERDGLAAGYRSHETAC